MPPASSAHLSQPHKPTFTINRLKQGQNSFSGKDASSMLQKFVQTLSWYMQFKTTKLLKEHVSWPCSRWPWLGPLLFSTQKKKGVEQHPHSLSDGRKAENIRGYFLTPYGFHCIQTAGSPENTPKGTFQSYEGCAPGKTSLKQRNQSTNNSDRWLEILRIWQPPCITKLGQVKQDVNAQKLSTGTVRGSRDCKENTREPKKVVPVTESTPDMRVFHLCTSARTGVKTYRPPIYLVE